MCKDAQTSEFLPNSAGQFILFLIENLIWYWYCVHLPSFYPHCSTSAPSLKRVLQSGFAFPLEAPLLPGWNLGAGERFPADPGQAAQS